MIDDHPSARRATSWPAATLALVLAACGPAGEPAADAQPPAAPDSAAAAPSVAPTAGAPLLAIDGEGLRLVDPASGSTTPIPFGTPAPQLLAALGRSAQGLSADASAVLPCADDALRARRWPQGLTAVVREGSFVGWELGEGSGTPITTLSGVGIGASREHLEWSYAADVRRETEGDRFTAGALQGLLEGDGSAARVRAMWAGITCTPHDSAGVLESITPETHGVLFEGIPEFEDLLAGRAGDWFVVLGAFAPPAGSSGAVPGPQRTSTLMRPTDPRAAALQQRLWNAGAVPFAVWSDLLPNFAPGMVVLVLGPFSREQAEERAAALGKVVPGAYAKSGW